MKDPKPLKQHARLYTISLTISLCLGVGNVSIYKFARFLGDLMCFTSILDLNDA